MLERYTVSQGALSGRRAAQSRMARDRAAAAGRRVGPNQSVSISDSSLEATD